MADLAPGSRKIWHFGFFDVPNSAGAKGSNRGPLIYLVLAWRGGGLGVYFVGAMCGAALEGA